MKHSRSSVLSMCWCDDMNVAIGYKDGDIRIINIISAEILHTFQDHSGGVTTMAYVEHQDRWGCIYVCVCVCMRVSVCTCVCVCVCAWVGGWVGGGLAT